LQPQCDRAASGGLPGDSRGLTGREGVAVPADGIRTGRHEGRKEAKDEAEETHGVG